MNPDEILHENAETYNEKERDYGKSWTLGGETLSRWAGDRPVVLETDQDFIAFGLFTRRLDKLMRAFNLEFLQDEEPNFESLFDTHADESTYAAMHASLVSEPETVTYVNDGGFAKTFDAEVSEHVFDDLSDGFEEGNYEYHDATFGLHPDELRADPNDLPPDDSHLDPELRDVLQELYYQRDAERFLNDE